MKTCLRTLCAAVLMSAASLAGAAGMTTHAMMADVARFKLPPQHPLIDLLEHHRAALIAGAMFPDGGYFTGAAFEADRDLAETSHWDSYTDALAGVAHEAGCGDVDPAADRDLRNAAPHGAGSDHADPVQLAGSPDARALHRATSKMDLE